MAEHRETDPDPAHPDPLVDDKAAGAAGAPDAGVRAEGEDDHERVREGEGDLDAGSPGMAGPA